MFDPEIPAECPFRVQSEIAAENLILAAGGRKSRRHAGVQRSVRLANQITRRFAPGPDITKLIEMIETPAADQCQLLPRLECQLREYACFIRVIAHECWLGPERLRDKRPLLPGIDSAVEKSGC